MKNKNKTFTGLMIVLVIGLTVGLPKQMLKAQTITNAPSPLSSGLQQIYDAATSSTNFGVAIGGGRSTIGQRSLAFADLAYNFNQNVGLLIGYDYLTASKHLNQPSQANLVKGGLNLQVDLKPFKNFGLTNFTLTPFGFALMASGNGNVSEILGGGVKTKILSFKGVDLNAGVLYEDRTGAGFWNGRYVAGFLALSKGF